MDDHVIINKQPDLLEINAFWHKEKGKTIVPKIESLNKFVGKAARVNPFHWDKYCDHWKYALRHVPDVDRANRKAYVTIVTLRSRLLDKVNRYGGAKPIEDLLVKKGWIKDDTDDWCDLSVHQTVSKIERTFIKVVY